jgi:hypothetical protein
LKEIDPPEQKCESDSSSKGGLASEGKYKEEGAIKTGNDLPDWGYTENGRDWPDRYPKCGLPQ